MPIVLGNNDHSFTGLDDRRDEDAGLLLTRILDGVNDTMLEEDLFTL